MGDVPVHDLYGRGRRWPSTCATDLAPQAAQPVEAHSASLVGLFYGDAGQAVERPEEVGLLGKGALLDLHRAASDTDHQARRTGGGAGQETGLEHRADPMACK